MKGFFKDFQIQIRRTMFVEMGAQFYGGVITKALCTASTLLFCLLEPSQRDECFSQPHKNRLQCSLLLLLRRGFGDEEDAALSGLPWEGESGCTSTPV